MLEGILNSIRRRLGFYDSHGLRYSQKHLAAVKSHIGLYSTDQQSKYVDRTVKYSIDHKYQINTIVDKDLELINEETWFEKDYTTTAVGNLAYISMYHPNAYYRQKAWRCLEHLKANKQEELKKKLKKPILSH